MRNFLHSPQRYRQAGLSLVEASLALVICGILVIVLWQIVVVQVQQESQGQSDLMLERAKTSIDAYAFIHARLPCPALNTKGVEACDGASEGYLPYMTLGLPEPDAGQLRYAVSSVAPLLTGDSAFGFRALMNLVPATATIDPVATLVPVKALSSHADGMLDFCAALAAPGTAETAAFAVSAKPDSYTAKILQPAQPVTRLQLLGRLHCPALVTTAGRAHFNTQLAAASMSKAIQDYRTQFEVAYGLAYFDLAQGIWFMSNGLYGAWRKWARVNQSYAAWAAEQLNPPTAAAKHAKAVRQIQARVMSGVYALAMISNVARFANNKRQADETQRLNNILVDNAIRLEQEITRNAVLNSASAFFLSEQKGAPVTPVQLPDGPPHVMTETALKMIDMTKAFAGEGGVDTTANAEQEADPTRSSDADSRQLLEALSKCANPQACDAVTAAYSDRIRQQVDALSPTGAASPAATSNVTTPADTANNPDKEFEKRYEAVSKCGGDSVECNFARADLAAYIKQKASGGTSADTAPAPTGSTAGSTAEEMAAKLQACSSDKNCDTAAIRSQMSKMIESGKS